MLSRGPHAPLGAVADDRAPDFLCGGKSNSHGRLIVLSGASLHNDGTLSARLTLRRSEEVWPDLKPDNGKIGLRHPDAPGFRRLSGKPLTALGAPTSDHLLAILGGHTRAPAVTARTHETGGLQCALHENGSGSKSSGGE